MSKFPVSLHDLLRSSGTLISPNKRNTKDSTGYLIQSLTPKQYNKTDEVYRKVKKTVCNEVQSKISLCDYEKLMAQQKIKDERNEFRMTANIFKAMHDNKCTENENLKKVLREKEKHIEYLSELVSRGVNMLVKDGSIHANRNSRQFDTSEVQQHEWYKMNGDGDTTRMTSNNSSDAMEQSQNTACSIQETCCEEILTQSERNTRPIHHQNRASSFTGDITTCEAGDTNQKRSSGIEHETVNNDKQNIPWKKFKGIGAPEQTSRYTGRATFGPNNGNIKYGPLQSDRRLIDKIGHRRSRPIRESMIYDQKRLLLAGLAPGTSTTYIQYYIEGRADYDDELKLYWNKDNDRVIVQFNKSKDDSFFENFKQRMKGKELKGSQPRMSRLVVTYRVSINNIKGPSYKLDKETLKLFFERRKIGGDVDTVSIDHGNNTALISFQKHEAVEKLLDRGTVEINGLWFEVYPFFPSFGLVTGNEQELKYPELEST
ncbi:uncharacterized protein LOC144443762 [Glandiceps talaboti]